MLMDIFEEAGELCGVIAVGLLNGFWRRGGGFGAGVFSGVLSEALERKFR